MKQLRCIFELRMELIANLRSDLVAATVNARTDSGADIARPGAEVALHFANSFLNDALNGSAPAGVKDANCSPFIVGEDDRNAVGSENAQEHAWFIGNHAVSGERMLRRPVDGMNQVGVNLSEGDERRGF